MAGIWPPVAPTGYLDAAAPRTALLTARMIVRDKAADDGA
jgi:hypothetical protein